MPDTRQQVMYPVQSRPQPNYYQQVTPQSKMIYVNESMGNRSIAQQQGTSRVLYDSLPLDATTNNFAFFRDVQTRVFPFTNLNQNRLNPGESLAIQRMYFCVLEFNPVTGAVVAVTPLATSAPGFYGANFSLNIAQQEVIKKFPLMSLQSLFNKASKFANNDIIEFDTDLIIPAQIEFEVDLQCAPYVAIANKVLMCVMEGTGSLLAAKQNF